MSKSSPRRQHWVELSDVSGGKRKVPSGDILAGRDLLVSGNCHSLAVAIHNLTDFSLACFRELPDGNPHTEHEPHIRHVAVISPEGWVLDGYGVTGLSDITRQKNWSVEIAENEQHLRKMINYDASEYGRYWLPFEETKLLPFAAAILHLYLTN